MKKFIIIFFAFFSVINLFFVTKHIYATKEACEKNGGACQNDDCNPLTQTNIHSIDCIDNQSATFCCKSIKGINSINIKVEQPSNVKIDDVGKLIGALISAVFVIAGLIAFAFLIWGGVQWITSGGDKAGVEAAQKRIQAALIGLIVVVASWAIMSLVAKFLGIDIFNLNFQTPF